jgi:2-oxoglutarate ferredoxin oxidoreductase subunit beta
MSETIVLQEAPRLTRKDFMSDQAVRWCPGCGDYAILAQVQRVLPELGIPRENIVFISGIGCSSRFPYYMNTYGIHSIHGRAPTLATGLKIANPELTVFVITGDGDGLAIGGNHLLHICRRNVDVTILLFNNRIYGLTKGQYSPTSPPGTRTKSSPMGTLEQAFNPISVALSAEATFIARTVDVHTKHMAEILAQAVAHRGTSFVEILQNCVIFNDKTWAHVTDASVKDENRLLLEHGKPMIFGKNRDKGIRLNGLHPEVVSLDEVPIEEILVHDVHAEDPHLAYMLSRMNYPEFPVPLGVFRQIERPTYESGIMAQIEEARRVRGAGKLRDLYTAADTWTVTGRVDGRSARRAPGAALPGYLDEAYLDLLERGEELPTEIQHSLTTDPIIELDPKPPVTVIAETPLANAIWTMRTHNIGCLLVTDEEGRLIGIFTEHDVLHKIACQIEDLSHATVGEFMTPNPSTLHMDAPIAHALHLMALHRFRHVPIVDDEGHPRGIISLRDILDFVKQHFGK